jgi:hypothetical protein
MILSRLGSMYLVDYILRFWRTLEQAQEFLASSWGQCLLFPFILCYQPANSRAYFSRYLVAVSYDCLGFSIPTTTPYVLENFRTGSRVPSLFLGSMPFIPFYFMLYPNLWTSRLPPGPHKCDNSRPILLSACKLQSLLQSLSRGCFICVEGGYEICDNNTDEDG